MTTSKKRSENGHERSIFPTSLIVLDKVPINLCGIYRWEQYVLDCDEDVMALHKGEKMSIEFMVSHGKFCMYGS